MLQIVFCLTFFSEASAQALLQFDVFPLRNNLHYSYDYLSRSWTRELGYLVQLNVDSGIVEYIVRDSILQNDTTLTWTIEERHALWHRRLFFASDTNYWTFDTLQFPLRETLTGNHELIGTSLIWSFPLTDITQSVYRFHDTTSLTLVHTFIPPGPSFGTDTLWFSDSSGYSHRYQTSNGAGGMTTWGTTLLISLRSNPVVSVSSRSPTVHIAKLEQNYPNPFNPSTTIEYELLKHADVSLCLYDILGRQVKVLDHGTKIAGRYSVIANLSDLGAGVYFYRLRYEQFSETKTLLLIK